MNKCKHFIAIVVICIVCCHCGPPSYRIRIRTEPSNFIEKLNITKENVGFFYGKYIGNSTDCFPPITNRVCENYTNKPIYEIGAAIDAEYYSISIKDTSVITSKVVNDLSYLVAAELTSQRGFNTFTVTNTLETAVCSNLRSYNTYGTITDSRYSGTTYSSDASICVSSFKINVFMYDDNVDLTKGVFVRNYTYNITRPFKELYIGTIPYSTEESIKQKLDTSEYYKRTNMYGSPNDISNAYKIKYDIKGLSAELRKNYSIIDNTIYMFIDKSEEHKRSVEKHSSDPIEKYKNQQ